jgi:hypothetical protein
MLRSFVKFGVFYLLDGLESFWGRKRARISEAGRPGREHAES